MYVCCVFLMGEVVRRGQHQEPQVVARALGGAPVWVGLDGRRPLGVDSAPLCGSSG